MLAFSMQRRLAAEAIGSAFLLATVVGSGIMAERLAGGNVAIALLGNTLPTGAILYVLITLFGPVSGAHFNPAVTLIFALRRQLKALEASLYVAAQIVGAILGVWLAHLMFDEQLLQLSLKGRTGAGQWLAESLATFGLLLSILMAVRFKPESVAMVVGLYITAAYWFTASTSFANPSVTLARSLSNTFAGISPSHVALFVLFQIIGAVLAHGLERWFFAKSERT